MTEEKKREQPLARLYDWMLRRRLLREPEWGQPSFAQRLLRIRLLSALVLSLPALLLCAWYSWLGILAHVGHQVELKVQEPLTLALFHLHLHDRLSRDWQRLSMPEPQRKSLLPTLGLALDGSKLDTLDKHLPPDDGRSYYVDGFLIRNGRAHEVQVRYRGGKYWHHRHPQKSWKVRAKDGKSIGGFETFSLLNPTEAVPFEEAIILQIARERGLLTPEHFPVRLLLNKSYMGVYFFEAQPDAGLLRRAGRAPGSVYSGSEAPIDADTGVSSLFRSADNFTKVSQGIHQQLGERNELHALVRAVNASTPAEFSQYASRHLDLDKFAAFDALDVTFGCNQHDFADNHKLYFDPYRGRFEPIVWNFRGCKHETEFNRTDNPLLLRMKQIPGYLARRNRIIYELLQGAVASASLRERTRAFLDKLQPDQIRDRYWDANQLLPAINPYYSQLLRPLSRELQDSATESRLHELGRRNRFLVGVLEKQAVAVALSGCSRSPKARRNAHDEATICTLDVTVSGESGYLLSRIGPSCVTACKPSYWQAYADTNLDDQLQLDRDEPLVREKTESSARNPALNLYTGVRFDARRVHPTRGKIRAVSESRRYRLFLHTHECALAGVTLDFENLVTGTTFSLSTAPEDRRDATVAGGPCSEMYREEPGYSSPHPWCQPRAHSEVIALGPGVVEISRTRVFPANQSVVIAPGTTLRMASRTSLVFYGRLDANGSREAPIRFEPAEGRWGGIAIQGPGAVGSRLSHVTFALGSRPDVSGALWPGVVNVHDVERVAAEHCSVESPSAEAGIHISGVRDLSLRHLRVSDAQQSGIEVKYSIATLDQLTITNSAGSGIVCAGSQIVLKNSRIAGSGQCGISARQLTTLSVQDSLVANAMCGLDVQEASTLEQQRVLLYRDGLGVRLVANDDRFPGKARLTGGVLHAVDCGFPFERENRSEMGEGQIVTRLLGSELETLRTQVLGIAAWEMLNESIAGLMSGTVR